jgi:hypothetical protein
MREFPESAMNRFPDPSIAKPLGAVNVEGEVKPVMVNTDEVPSGAIFTISLLPVSAM